MHTQLLWKFERGETNLMDNFLIYISNGCIATWYYILSYFWYFVLLALLITAGVIEFKEKQFLFIDDERKIV